MPTAVIRSNGAASIVSITPILFAHPASPDCGFQIIVPRRRLPKKPSPWKPIEPKDPSFQRANACTAHHATRTGWHACLQYLPVRYVEIDRWRRRCHRQPSDCTVRHVGQAAQDSTADQPAGSWLDLTGIHRPRYLVLTSACASGVVEGSLTNDLAVWLGSSQLEGGLIW